MRIQALGLRQRSAADLAAYLGRRSRIPTGRAVLNYSLTQFPFKEAVVAYLTRRIPGFCGEDLAALHEMIPKALQTRAEKGINGASCRVDQGTPELIRVYHGFVQHLAESSFREDLVFEATPQLRFHFPVPARDLHRRADGRLACQHSDIMFGDYFEQTNCWLPITDCHGTNALHIASLAPSIDYIKEFIRAKNLDLAGFYSSRETFFGELNDNERFHASVHEACTSLSMRYGELLAFDPRCLHATAENVERTTRVSVDFRVMTVSEYESATSNRRKERIAATEIGGEPLLRGSFFHAQTALALKEPSL